VCRRSSTSPRLAENFDPPADCRSLLEVRHRPGPGRPSQRRRLPRPGGPGAQVNGSSSASRGGNPRGGGSWTAVVTCRAKSSSVAWASLASSSQSGQATSDASYRPRRAPSRLRCSQAHPTEVALGAPDFRGGGAEGCPGRDLPACICHLLVAELLLEQSRNASLLRRTTFDASDAINRR
jgi:hypothetical protein